jgi:hypothetical protein
MREAIMKHLSTMVCVVLAACATAKERTGVVPPTRIPDVVQSVRGPEGKPVAAASIPKAVRRAVVADAAQRFRVARSAVVITRAESVTWTDASLGCAEPGQMYTQALVPGFRVAAKTAEGELEYHADAGGRIVSCGH